MMAVIIDLPREMLLPLLTSFVLLPQGPFGDDPVPGSAGLTTMDRGGCWRTVVGGSCAMQHGHDDGSGITR